MEPPPASLEAMVRSRPGSPLAAERGVRWVWIALALVTLGVAMYYVGLRR